MTVTGTVTGPARLSAAACALIAFSLSSAAGALAAPLAADLGPVVSLGEPAGGFVGRLSVTPEHGPVGTPVTVSGQGLPPGQDIDVVWRTVRGSWKVGNGEYNGRAFDPVAYRIATVKSDASGAFTATFTAPDDFGFSHDIVAQQGGRLLTQSAFMTDMTMTLASASARGPVGSPIAVEIKGMGWKEMQDSWMVLYDNKFTGFASVVTTHGGAHFTVPATGQPGTHIVELLHSDFGSPYRNTQQSPFVGRPQFKLTYTITPGAPALPPPPPQQVQRQVRSLPAAGDLTAVPAFAGVGQPVTVRAPDLKAGEAYKLNWSTVVGNRMSGQGWEEQGSVVAEATADAAGLAEFHFKTPDDLGGVHMLWVDAPGTRKSGGFWLAPSALPLDIAHGPAGTTFKIHLKGVGWTETANIYTVVYDNAGSGYACGFNSQGDVEIFMQATGEPGWHFIDLYPAIYKGKETRPNNYRLPQLTYADDHPGEDLPAFHFAFEVTEGGTPVGQ
jgi:hypothetical protein